MIGYNELYELLRKEKYSEQLQPLPKKFIEEFKVYLDETKDEGEERGDILSGATKSKKQFENSLSLFRELILKRKKKIMNLVFVATETGIMKRDYENMLPVEKVVFDRLVETFETSDKEVAKILSGKQGKKDENKMVIFKQDVDQFMDHEGAFIGPFKSGQLVNLNVDIASILVQGEKANFVDDS